MAGTMVPRIRTDIGRLGLGGLTWVDFAAGVAEAVSSAIPFDAYCLHTVDPGTIMFTGSVNRDVGCSGSWLAHHEYVVEDVNKWSFLAHSGRIAGATSIDTHGQLSRSTRFRSQAAYGFGDELSLDPWTGRLIAPLAVVDHGVVEWACRDCWSAQRFHRGSPGQGCWAGVDGFRLRWVVAGRRRRRGPTG